MKRLAFLVLALPACAATDAESGRAAQGGSTGSAPSVTVTVSFAGPVSVAASSVPTAAPAASSEAKTEQGADAKADVTATVPAGGLSLTPPGR